MGKSDFSWSQLGDIENGRPNLGKTTHVAIYRLMQYTIRAVLEMEYGDEQTRNILHHSGRLAGREFCENMLDVSLPLDNFLAQLHAVLIELSIGILKIEKSNAENYSFVVVLFEDLDCAGLPIRGVTVCDYDEGFFEGIFNVYTGKEFQVKEIDCWTTGERACRFSIELKKTEN